MEITCFVMPDLISLPRQVVRRGHPGIEEQYSLGFWLLTGDNHIGFRLVGRNDKSLRDNMKLLFA
jgi:hypothetical protein